MALKFYNVCSMPLVLQLVVLNILVRGQNLGLEKPGRCASVSGKCSAGPSPSSRCFFHFECPGKQLCCSIDGCINACVDPVLNFNDSRISDLLSRSDMLLSAADNAYVLNPNVVQKGPYLKCKAGLLIKTSYRCNGKNDCPDGDNSDEMDCPCSADEVLCTNGLCVNLAAVCLPTGTRNGLCSVPSLNCSSINCSSSDHFRCNNGQCVPLNNRCDGIFSCLDGSDEQDCACSSGNFNCDDGLCKSLLNVWCNGAADCSDRSDESANCSCIPGQFTCTNGRCIPQYKKCDFIDDCLDGSDETDCTVKCTASNKLFQCGSGQCIPVYSQCDGFPDCQDASDESNCVDNKPNNCHRAGYFSCGNSSSTVEKCVPLSAWCDGVTDCPDHTDEPLFCSTTCPNASMSCDGGRCISLASKCDGKVDCTDKTDESGCQCQENELPLPNSACLARDKFCNGVRDAANGLDEEQCRACKERLAQNFPGKLCDGIIDCPDASDELFCGHCTTAQFFCQKSHQCIFRNQTCDGYPDCNPYGEDEETCLGVTPAPCHIDADMTSIQSERAGCLTVRNRGEWMPVCAERWLSSLSDAICEIMGYDKSLSTNLVPMEPGEIPERPLKMPRQFDGAQLVISAAFSCPSRKKVYLECGSLLCGQSLPDNGLPKYITGYNKVAAGEHPWSALLYQDGKYICSAVIVDAEWVLTSAKCVATIDLASSFVVVRVGMIRRFSRNANEQFLPVDFIAMHPNFTVSINPEIATADADLALLHLAVPVHWNAFAKPVCLPRSSDPPESITLTGWGVVMGQSVFSNEDAMQQVTVNAINSTFCQKNPFLEKSLTVNSFCANFSGISPGNCTTDHGGPALNKDYYGRWSVVGVASFVLGCNQTGAVVGLVNVAKHRTWITDVMTKSAPTKTLSDKLCMNGHRCEVGSCINPSQRCDGTTDCPLGSDEYNCLHTAFQQNQTGSCNFSDASLCGYRQDISDTLDFYRGNVGDSSFPINREKWLLSFSGSFLYISSLMTNGGKGATARLISPRINPIASARCLKVNFLAGNGSLTVYDYADPTRMYTIPKMGDDATPSLTQWVLPQNTSLFVLEAKLTADKDAFVAMGGIVLDAGSCPS